ncbi:MAG: hypothetical protein IJC46_02185 [Clostridia bacterium]|nr:hypothetical protein [Clostridia bacterium]
MNSRERVRSVLNHQIPDRVPNGLGGCETAGMHIVAYDKLQHILGVSPQPPRVDTFMTNAVFEEPLIKAMEGDILLVASPGMCRSELRGDVASQWKEQQLWGKTYRVSVGESFIQNPDGSIIWRGKKDRICPAGTYYFETVSSASDLTMDFEIPDPDAFQPENALNDQTLRRLEETAKYLYETTDYSLCMGEAIRDLQISPGGMIGGMILMKEEPEIMQAFLEKCLQAALEQLKLLEQAVGKYVDILSIAHDFGDNRGVMIGAPLWRELYKPFYRRLFEGWHNTTSMKINLHSCGSIQEIMGDLIECGVDIINPVQTSAANMEAASLKEQFGDRVIFWGGAYDAQLIHVDADYEQVYQAVSQNIKTLRKGGNYIFAGVHNLPANMPEHHIKAMIDAYRATSNY